MKIPSKRAKEIKAATEARDAAADALRRTLRDESATVSAKTVTTDSLARELIAAERALAEAEALPDMFTCPQCGKDFEGEHVELNVAALLQFEPDGTAKERFDFGLSSARRFKFCGGCIGKWKIKPTDYINL